jgi:hypothetical protein
MTPAQQETLDALRGDPAKRPVVDHALRAALQGELDLATQDFEGRLTIDKHRLSKVHQCEGRYTAVELFEWRPASARGTIAHKAVEMSIQGVKPMTPHALIDEAVSRICESPDTQSLAEYLRGVGDGERAEIRSEAANYLIEFLEMFPPMQAHWIPHAEATTAAFTGGKRIVCRGKIDLKLGQLNGDRSSTVIIDIKTGSPSFTDLDDLRFYGLLETLRTGVPPFQWANAYIAAGRLEVERCTEATLWAGMRRLVDGIHKIARLEHGKQEPRLTPGMGCRFCPSKPVCVESSRADQLQGILER